MIFQRQEAMLMQRRAPFLVQLQGPEQGKGERFVVKH